LANWLTKSSFPQERRLTRRSELVRIFSYWSIAELKGGSLNLIDLIVFIYSFIIVSPLASAVSGSKLLRTKVITNMRDIRDMRCEGNLEYRDFTPPLPLAPQR
jgi:hypothetical protein